jgi:hypothetical protein
VFRYRHVSSLAMPFNRFWLAMANLNEVYGVSGSPGSKKDIK